MEYNEQLMNESLQGNRNSLKELKYYAGAGDCEAQYFLAMYYAKSCGHLHAPDYHYWLEKSKNNGYVSGVGRPKVDDDGMKIDSYFLWNYIKIWVYLLSFL